ncbi:MAG: hypothetical protein U0903_02540 [Planctomycetales bacterium]
MPKISPNAAAKGNNRGSQRPGRQDPRDLSRRFTPAPLLAARQRSINNVDETDRVLFDDIASKPLSRGLPANELPGFEPAGPRKKIYFDPS